MIDPEMLKCVLTDNGWEFDERQPDEWYWRFRKGKDILDYWFTTGTCRIIKNNIAKYSRDNTIEKITKLL